MATEPFYIKQNTKRIAYIHIETSEKCTIVLALTAAETKNIRHFKHDFSFPLWITNILIVIVMQLLY